MQRTTILKRGSIGFLNRIDGEDWEKKDTNMLRMCIV